MSIAALERQIRPIYDSLDTGSPKIALATCNKLRKKYPQNTLIKALKSLALVRLQKFDEAIAVCDDVLSTKTTDESTLSAMQHVLRGLGRHKDMIAMFESAFKLMPNNEEIGSQYFFANVRAGLWKAAQQIATKLHKQFNEERFLYWAAICYVNQANEAATPSDMKRLLYKLAHRLLSVSSKNQSFMSADRFYLNLMVLRELEMYDDAFTLVDSDYGRSICSTNLACNEIRRIIWRAKGLIKEEGVRAEERLQQRDRNWMEFLSVIDAAVLSPDEALGEENSVAKIQHARQVFQRIISSDGTKDRAGLLALLELEKRARERSLSKDPHEMVRLMKRYFDRIGDKPCCFEDLKSFLDLSGDDLAEWTKTLLSTNTEITDLKSLRRVINVQMLLRYNLNESEMETKLEFGRAITCLKQYTEGNQLVSDWLPTDPQPGEDLLILAAEIFTTAWILSKDQLYLHNAVITLEFGLSRSEHAFQMRLMLIRLYRLLCVPAAALDHYRALNVKQIQHDTISHYILTRASTFSLAATGDLTYLSECMASSQVYLTNTSETSDLIVRAFQSEKYSQIPEFIKFEDRVDNSLARDLVKMEHVRMRISHETVTSELIDLELIELKFIFLRLHHDNRDFGLLPSHQPTFNASFNEQTYLFSKDSGTQWLTTFLAIYIRVFQHASDLKENVEDSLLLGDRPKHAPEGSTKFPWKDRLKLLGDLDSLELTPEENTLREFASLLGDWLEPLHDHIRPVAAKEANQNNVSVGTQVQCTSEGRSSVTEKNVDDDPIVKEPPAALMSFFESMLSDFRVKMDQLDYTRAVHIAQISQEAYLLYKIETARFKSSSVIKAHKLTSLPAHIKNITHKATQALMTLSQLLANASEVTAARAHFIQSCSSVQETLQIEHDSLLEIASKITEGRKRLFLGLSHGLSKLCAYS